jgi:site-specific recombinase XerD
MKEPLLQRRCGDLINELCSGERTMPRKKVIEKHKGVYEKHPGTGVFWIRYSSPDGRKTERVGSHAAAVDLYKTRMGELSEGGRLGVVPKRAVKFETIAKDALVFSAAYHTDKRNFRQRLEIINRDFQHRPADSILPSDISKWLQEGVDEWEWEPSTCNRYKAVFSKVFKLALADGKVKSNPARLVPQRKESPGRLRFLQDEEEVRLREVILKNRPYCMYQLDIALNTGMRLTEQFTIETPQIDRRLHQIHLDMTKNGSAREVLLNSAAQEAIERLLAERKKLGISFPSLFFYQNRHTKKFEPISNPREWFRSAVEEARIENMTWHILRHTFASRLVMAKVPLKTVQELMGHKTIAMTARYAHLSPGHKTEALECLVNPTSPTL